MYLDLDSPPRWHGNVVCKGCNHPIPRDDPIEVLRFEKYGQSGLRAMSGTYHARCAAPLRSIIRAMEMLHHPSLR